MKNGQTREYRRDNEKWTNRKHRAHMTNASKKHNTICVGHNYTQTNTYTVNKT